MTKASKPKSVPSEVKVATSWLNFAKSVLPILRSIVQVFTGKP